VYLTGGFEFRNVSWLTTLDGASSLMPDAQETLIPNTLFKYVSADGGLATLQEKAVCVMFSKPSDLNDPFEFLPSLDKLSFKPDELNAFGYLSSHFLSATADSLRYEIELHWFITSFSRAEHNVRMWAQYGDDHRGICLTFDLSKAPLSLQKGRMRPVDYTKTDRVDVLDFGNLTPEQKGERLKQVATQKGKDWKHEEEVRWFLRDDDRDRPDKTPFEKKVVDGKMRAFMRLPHASNRSLSATEARRHCCGRFWKFGKCTKPPGKSPEPF
jgi:hypothetical protein